MGYQGTNMSGILDSKTRMLDTVVTDEGKRQIAAGELRIKFVSFTDCNTFYESDIISGSTDASDRLFLEVGSLPQDRITFESDDSGKLKPLRGSNIDVLDGKILSGSSTSFLGVVTGSAFSSLAEVLADTTVNNFQKLQLIRTEDNFFDAENEFAVNTNEVEFSISDAAPINPGQMTTANIDDVETLFQDKRLSHLPNFKYLPPVNTDGTSLGDYPLLGQQKSELSYTQLMGELANKEKRVIEFSQNTLQANVMCQFFEFKQDRLLKLDAIDFGEISTGDQDFPNKRIYFIGKLFIDSFGAHTFVNIFTLIFE